MKLIINIFATLLVMIFISDFSSAAIIESRIDKGFEKIIKTNDGLKYGGIRYVRKGKKLALISTASAVPKSESSKDKHSALRIAEICAKKNIVAFLSGVSVSSEEEVAMQSLSDGDKQYIEEVFTSRIKTNVEGVLTGTRKIGTWKIDTEDNVYCGLAILLEGGNSRSSVSSQSKDSPLNRSLNREATPSKKNGNANPSNGDSEDIIVVVVGRYAYDGNVQFSRNKAIQDACERAVEQALGKFLSSKQITDSEELIEDSIIAHAEGFITGYKLIDEKVVDTDSYSVKIRAKVGKGRIIKECEAVGILNIQVGMPKVSIVTIESVLESGQQRVNREDAQILKNLLDREFASANFEQFDMKQMIEQMKMQDSKQWDRMRQKMAQAGSFLEPEFEQQIVARAGANADVIILGLNSLKYVGMDSDRVFHQYTSKITIRALYAGTGRILATVTESLKGRGTTKDVAITNTCKMMLPHARELIPQILDRWQGIVNNGREITFSVENPHKKAYKINKAILNVLKETQGVSSCEKKFWKKPRLQIILKFKGTTTDFCERVEDRLAEALEELGIDFEGVENVGDSFQLQL